MSTRFSEGCMGATAAGFSLLLALPLGACSQQASAVQEEATEQVPGPANTTFSLAPTAAQAAAADDALAAQAPDAPPSPGTAPASEGASTGAPSPGCVNGWKVPERGSPLRGAVLDMMRVRPGERFVVEEMRYFVGPEDAEVVGPRGDVERWYVKASTESEPRRRQRWLVRRAAVGSGVDALAPFESVGYGPATWRRPDAADVSLSDPFERPCQGSSPGQKCMGLPREVLGCLAGT